MHARITTAIVVMTTFCALSTPAGDIEATLDPGGSFRVLDTSSNQLFRIQDDGRVGVGAGVPAGKLHLSDDGPVELLLEADRDNIGETDQPLLTLSQDNGIVKGHFGFVDSSNYLTIQHVYGADTTTVQVGINRNIYLEGDVSVGGGEGADGSAEGIWLDGQSAVWVVGAENKTNEADSAFFVSRGSGQSDGTFHIDRDGHVGVGTSNPGATLHVNGETRADALFGNGGVLTVGTHDDAPLELTVNDIRGLRLESATNHAVNVIGGSSENFVAAGIKGATISGGGESPASEANAIRSHFGVIAGGYDNTITSGSVASVVGGGAGNDVGYGAWHSTIGGGFGNTVEEEAIYSTIGGGRGNAAMVQSPIHQGCSVVGGGEDNRVLGDWSTISGGRSNAVFETQYATIPGGRGALARSYGQQAYASGWFSASGDAQSSLYVLRRTVTSAGTFELFLDGDTASKRLLMSPDGTWVFDILVVGRSNTGHSQAYRIEGAIESFGGVGLVDPPVVTTIAEDLGSPSAYVTAGSNGLRLFVNSSSSDTFRWVASVRTVEVEF